MAIFGEICSERGGRSVQKISKIECIFFHNDFAIILIICINSKSFRAKIVNYAILWQNLRHAKMQLPCIKHLERDNQMFSRSKISYVAQGFLIRDRNRIRAKIFDACNFQYFFWARGVGRATNSILH